MASLTKATTPCPKRRRRCAAGRVKTHRWGKTKDAGSPVSNGLVATSLTPGDHLSGMNHRLTGRINKCAVSESRGYHIPVWVESTRPFSVIFRCF